MHASPATAAVRRPGRTAPYAARARRASVLALAAVLTAAPAARADNGFDVSSESSYTLEAKKDAVSATMTITVRNDRPSVRTGNYIQYYYLPLITIPLPADAEQVTAISNGASLSVTQEPTKDPSTDIATIRFPSNLLYGQSRTITVRFVLKGEKPRSPNQTRVGPGYATFAVYGPGDAGQNTVEVVLPASMRFDATTDLFSRDKNGATRTYTATENNVDAGFWAVISARDPKVAKTEKVEIGGKDVKVRAYQDDPRWLSFVTSRMTEGVPVLEDLIGTPWPGGLTTVREDRSVNVRGYDGWFDARASEIVIGEELDQETLYHELTHAWATSATLGERWISEGIAQELAARAVTELGGKPRKQRPVSPRGRAAIPLSTWGADPDGRAQAADAYGYPASYQVVRTLLADLGERKRSRILAAAVAGESAYSAPGEGPLSSEGNGWRRFYDLLQIVGESDQTAPVFSRWVLTPQEQALMVPRASALTAYREVDRADGAFVPPIGLRREMTAWDFPAARQALREVQDLGPAAADVQEAAERYDMEVPEQVAGLYQLAEDTDEYAALAKTLPEAAAAIAAVGEADRAAAADRNPFAALGARLLDVDGKTAKADRLLADAELEEASAAADEARSAARWTTWLGLGIVVGGLLLLTVLGLLTRLLVRRRARRRTAAAAAAHVAASPVEGEGAVVPAGAPARPDEAVLGTAEEQPPAGG